MMLILLRSRRQIADHAPCAVLQEQPHDENMLHEQQQFYSLLLLLILVLSH